ncbi:hypothetical protein FNH05_25720 [Amycolatopsis rhizosphaerae]|uniref:Uncharacterized protein n=1 Tax=Amycolatopsis rhizosphaerae TaxID=2053003 RepID=A0A558BIS7_9PSEU|nr:hypothetical protein [Amycolatopsis rhizosphaerae]TVT36402.1 hypothetical protein FNH05_25720 [Amycolatopsis rhizosphaerae]
MATDPQTLADGYASAAQQTVEAAIENEGNALHIATVQALLAIFHQLKSMDGQSVQLKGAADLANAMHHLAHTLSP